MFNGKVDTHFQRFADHSEKLYSITSTLAVARPFEWRLTVPTARDSGGKARYKDLTVLPRVLRSSRIGYDAPSYAPEKRALFLSLADTRIVERGGHFCLIVGGLAAQ